MSSAKEDIVYELQTPFDYAHKGEMTTAMFITLRPPTSRHIVECAQLKQFFYRALPKNGEVEVEGEEGKTDLEPEDIISLLAMSQGVELSAVYLTARELFAKDIALVDGQERLTKPLLEKVDMDDLEQMIGAYMANFILHSVLQKMKTK